MPKKHGLSLDVETIEELKKLAKEEGLQTVSSFIRYLVKTYPTLKRIKEMFDSGLLVPATQDISHKQSEASRKGYYPLPFAETHKALINQADIKVLIQNLNITNEFKFVAITDRGLEEEEKAVIKPLKDYEPEIEEVYEKGVKIVSFKPKK